MLPCVHSRSTLEQINLTINLLKNLHTLHPEMLRKHNIPPEAYIDRLVFRSAIESIRGTYIASSQREREAMIGDFLALLNNQGKLHGYEYTGRGNRCDFTIDVTENYRAGLEVKGGEGNSIQISDKPTGAAEFAIWSHIDGSIQNSPSSGTHKVIGRILNEMRKGRKRIDVLFVRDRICNTSLRVCPKYSQAGSPPVSPLGVAPDIFLFPSESVTVDNPNPPMHTLNSLMLPKLMLELFEVPEENWPDHVWEVRISLVRNEQGQLELGLQTPLTQGSFTSLVSIWHKGNQVDKYRPQGQ